MLVVQTVVKIKHVLIRNVSTLALAPVELELTAKLLTTILSAVARSNTQVIPLLDATLYVSLLLEFLTPFNVHYFVEVIEPVVPTNPCQPSPCGINSECKVVGDSPACSCLPEFIGSPPNCRPECVSNSECADHLACINKKCKDPCPGVCGLNAQCRVISHTPNCFCSLGYVGDPFSQCIIRAQPAIEEIVNPCVPSPCGPNAVCRTQNNIGACSCLPDYTGDPYSGCRPECTVDSDCPNNKACIRNKCASPCPGACGTNAECQAIDHLPSCICRSGYTGNPFIHCNPIIEEGNCD